MNDLLDTPPKPSADAPPASECTHCRLPLTAATREAFGAFCCAGCRAVHALLHAEGLDRYYDLRGSTESPVPKLREDALAWLEPLLAAAEAASGGGLTRLSLDLQGVHCTACVWLLQQLFDRRPGGVDLRVHPLVGRVDLVWRTGTFDLREYLRAAGRFGFQFGPVRKSPPRGSRGLLVRMSLCVAAALNVMMFSLCYYLGLAPQDGRLYTVLGQWSFALAAFAVAVGGSLFVRTAIQGLRARVVPLDLPIALGVLLGFGGSVYAWWSRGPTAAYFDTVTVFLALMLVGRWLQERVLLRNRLSLLAEDGIDGLFSRRRTQAGIETVPSDQLAVGDELWIPPGDLVPVDGALLGDAAQLDLSWIDGESEPRRFEPGAVVPAGAFHLGTAPLRLTAVQKFSASRLHDLLGGGAETEASRRRRAQGDPWWSRVATIYVLSVLSLATLGMAAWWHAGVDRAVEVTLSLLVMTCPCALGLATPLAHELAHRALRRRGIFLREQGFLHRALRIRHVIFDKTGTLTRGTLRLSDAARRTLARMPAEDRRVLAAATARSLHPVSRCLAEFLSDGGPAPYVEGLETTELRGQGLLVRLGEREWRLGRPSFADPENASVHLGTCFASDRGGRWSFEVEEELRPDAGAEVRSLAERGFVVHLLSGDRSDRARRAAERLGIAPDRVRGEHDPEQKAAYVRSLGRDDTLMVGDGINDAPAFDAAACAATPAVDRPQLPARADLFFLGDGVQAVRTALLAARRWRVVGRSHLWLALAYNLVAVSACLAGWVNPLVAAVAMPLSSIALVTSTAIRLAPRSASWTS